MSKEFNYDEWNEKYHNKKYIEIMKFLKKNDIEVTNKLGIKVENRLYSEYELELLEMELSSYYMSDDMDEEDLEFSKSLDGTGVTREEYNQVLEDIQLIHNHYNF